MIITSPGLSFCKVSQVFLSPGIKTNLNKKKMNRIRVIRRDLLKLEQPYYKSCSLQHYRQGLMWPEFKIWEKRKRKSVKVFLALNENNQVMGWLLYSPYNIKTKKQFAIQIWVQHRFRRMGVGLKLMKAVTSFAKKNNHKTYAYKNNNPKFFNNFPEVDYVNGYVRDCP